MQVEIAKLPPEEFRILANWIFEERNRTWDDQILADSESGALDPLLREVEQDIAHGHTRPIDEICDNS